MVSVRMRIHDKIDVVRPVVPPDMLDEGFTGLIRAPIHNHDDIASNHRAITDGNCVATVFPVADGQEVYLVPEVTRTHVHLTWQLGAALPIRVLLQLLNSLSAYASL